MSRRRAPESTALPTERSNASAAGISTIAEERRRNARYTVGSLPCTVYHAGGEFPATVVTASLSGLQIADVPDHAHRTGIVTVGICLRGMGVFVAEATVRSDRVVDGRRTLGLAIEPVSEAHRERFARFIAAVADGVDVEIRLHDASRRPNRPPRPASPKPGAAGATAA